MLWTASHNYQTKKNLKTPVARPDVKTNSDFSAISSSLCCETDATTASVQKDSADGYTTSTYVYSCVALKATRLISRNDTGPTDHCN